MRDEFKEYTQKNIIEYVLEMLFKLLTIASLTYFLYTFHILDLSTQKDLKNILEGKVNYILFASIISFIGIFTLLLFKSKKSKKLGQQIIFVILEIFTISLILASLVVWNIHTYEYSLSSLKMLFSNYLDFFLENSIIILIISIVTTLLFNLMSYVSILQKFYFQVPIETINNTIHVAISFIIGVAFYTWWIDSNPNGIQVFYLFLGLFIVWLLCVGLIFLVNFLFESLKCKK